MKVREKRTDRIKDAGFTLVEVIVIVAVIAIVAGIVVPMLFKQIDEAKITRAEADCKSISSAILTFRKDLGVWPNLNGTPGSCTPGIGTLTSGAVMPAGLADMNFVTTTTLSLADVLGTDDLGCYNAQKYKGPYLPNVTADPWGNAYIVAASGFDVNADPVYVLSAGPNGTMETTVNEVTPRGDDIGIRIK